MGTCLLSSVCASALSMVVELLPLTLSAAAVQHALAPHSGFETRVVCGFCWVWWKREREREEERSFNQTKIQICKWSSDCSKWKQIVTKYDKECIFILYLGNLWKLMRLFHLFPWTMTLHCRECCMNIYSSSFSSCLDCKFMDYLSWSEQL